MNDLCGGQEAQLLSTIVNEKQLFGEERIRQETAAVNRSTARLAENEFYVQRETYLYWVFNRSAAFW